MPFHAPNSELLKEHKEQSLCGALALGLLSSGSSSQGLGLCNVSLVGVAALSLLGNSILVIRVEDYYQPHLLEITRFRYKNLKS